MNLCQRFWVIRVLFFDKVGTTCSVLGGTFLDVPTQPKPKSFI